MAATKAVVDLSNVKDGGNFKPRRVPEGDYKLKIVKADDHQPKDPKSPKGWVLTLQRDGDARATYPYYLSPAENQLWKIRAICVAAGLNVSKKRINFDPNKLVNKYIGAFLEEEEYEGKPKSTIGDVFPVSEIGANADEGEDIDTDEELADDEDTDEVVEEEDDEEEEEVVPVKKARKKAKPIPEPEPEDDDDEDDDEEEPPPPPVRKKKAAPAPVKKKARKVAPPVDDDDDLDELDTDDLDD